MRNLAIFFVALAAGMAAPAVAEADVSPTGTYCDYSLRGNGSHAPDADYPAWWNWYNANYWPKLQTTVSAIETLDSSAVNRDHQVYITYTIRTTMQSYVRVTFTCYWTPTSPAHGGGTYYDANISGVGPVMYP